MRPSVYLTLISATIGAAAALFGGASRSDQTPLRDTATGAVPGNNPLSLCHDDSQNIVKITHLDLDPNPPQPGKMLTINATAYLEEEVKEGAYVDVTISVSGIKLITTTQDICSHIEEVGKKCPVPKGETSVVKDVDIPAAVPPAMFTVLATAYTVDKKEMTCLTGVVDFSL